MQYTLSGLHLTEQFESCRLKAYPDSKGVWTCGWGHTSGVTPTTTCTQQQADAWLMEDVQVAVRAVNAYVKVTLTQDEFNALTDFCFNAGCHAFFCSTMLTLLNQGNYSAAAAQFIRWDKCGGVELAGLLRRRQAEMQEFMGHG